MVRLDLIVDSFSTLFEATRQEDDSGNASQRREQLELLAQDPVHTSPSSAGSARANRRLRRKSNYSDAKRHATTGSRIVMRNSKHAVLVF